MGHVAETQQQVIDLVSAIAAGEIQVTIEQEYPFERALEALKKTETRHARGKLVVRGRG
jgi:NADPH:quinone reductase-like Zn-dependent oxidoreductase